MKSTRVGPILLGSAGYRKQGYYFVWPYHCDYTDVGNGALRTSSMADTIAGSCLFEPISPIKRRN